MTTIKTSGKTVGNFTIEIEGLTELRDRMARLGINLFNEINFKIMQEGNFILEEVLESVAGNRVEPKSVDTGTFIKSIKFTMPEQMIGKIYVENNSYPNGTTTTEVAKFLEYGTSKNPIPRLHFNHTLDRNKDKINKDLKISVNNVVKNF